MSLRFSHLGPGLLVAVVLLCTNAVSQEPGANPFAGFEKYTKPGKQHASLAKFIGTWDVEVELFMPGAAPAKSKGTAEVKWLIKGRWLTSHMQAKFPLFNTDYEAHHIMGYDNFRQKWVSAGVTNMDTALVMTEGPEVDPTGKIRVQYGTLDEYMTGEVGKPFKVVTRFESDDKHRIEVNDLGIGENGAVVIAFNYTRRK